MTDMTDNRKTPNPGSDEAVERGCKCPVIDNAHGKGAYGGARDPKTGETQFFISGNCEMHREGEPS